MQLRLLHTCHVVEGNWAPYAKNHFLKSQSPRDCLRTCAMWKSSSSEIKASANLWTTRVLVWGTHQTGNQWSLWRNTATMWRPCEAIAGFVRHHVSHITLPTLSHVESKSGSIITKPGTWVFWAWVKVSRWRSMWSKWYLASSSPHCLPLALSRSIRSSLEIHWWERQGASDWSLKTPSRLELASSCVPPAWSLVASCPQPPKSTGGGRFDIGQLQQQNFGESGGEELQPHSGMWATWHPGERGANVRWPLGHTCLRRKTICGVVPTQHEEIPMPSRWLQAKCSVGNDHAQENPKWKIWMRVSWPPESSVYPTCMLKSVNVHPSWLQGEKHPNQSTPGVHGGSIQ